MKHYAQFGSYWFLFRGSRSVLIWNRFPTSKTPVYIVKFGVECTRHNHTHGLMGEPLGYYETQGLNNAKSVGQYYSETGDIPVEEDKFFLTVSEFNSGKSRFLYDRP